MAEKRGQTVKLIYDFPTQLSTEIGYEDGFWARVTCNRFRSYNGLRRIYHLDKEGKGEYKDYEGPVYYFDSNVVLKDKTKNETIENLEQLRWMDAGIKLIGSFIHNKPISVDTPEDLKKVVEYVNRQAN